MYSALSNFQVSDSLLEYKLHLTNVGFLMVNFHEKIDNYVYFIQKHNETKLTLEWYPEALKDMLIKQNMNIV